MLKSVIGVLIGLAIVIVILVVLNWKGIKEGIARIYNAIDHIGEL